MSLTELMTVIPTLAFIVWWAGSVPPEGQAEQRRVHVSYELKFSGEKIEPDRVKQAVEAACALYGVRAVDADAEPAEWKMRVSLSGRPLGAQYGTVGRRDTGWATSGTLVIEGARKAKSVRLPLSEKVGPTSEIRVPFGRPAPDPSRKDTLWLAQEWQNAGAWLAYRTILGHLARELGTEPLLQAVELRNPGLDTNWAFDPSVFADILIGIGDPKYAVALGSALTAKPKRLRAGSPLHKSLSALTRSKTLGPPWKASPEFIELRDKAVWQLSQKGTSNDLPNPADILEALKACDVLRKVASEATFPEAKSNLNEHVKACVR